MFPVVKTGRTRALSGLLFALSLSFSNVVAAETWTLNFKDADIQELIRFVADAVNVTVVVDPLVKGKIKVISAQPVETDELYDLFLSILEVHGFAAIRAGNVVRIVPQKDARSLAVPVVPEGANASRQNSEIVTQVVQLKNINAAKLIPILRPLVPQQAHMAAYTPSNAIIISDSAANISRMQRIIDRIDLAAVEETVVIQLRYASAEETVRILEQLQKTRRGSADDQKSVSMVPDQRTNSILVNADELERQRIAALVARLDRPLEQAGNARVRYLKYANAVDVAEVLNRVSQNVSKLEPGEGGAKGQRNVVAIEADEATNALIITAEQGQMQTLDAVIDRLDIRRAQVLVEAIIVEIVADGTKNLGIQWLFQNEDGFGSSANPPSALDGIIAAAAGTTTTIDDQGNETITTGDIDFSRAGVAAVLSSTPGQAFGIANIDRDGTSFVALLQALQQNTQANILSTPSLLTLDNSEASITVGQEVPFVTGSFSSTSSSTNPNNPFQTIQRESVGTKLNVTPHINEGDTIVLEIQQEVSSLTGLQASDIITNERKIESTIMVRDGDIVVLGGLVEDDVQESVQKVPLLGDIPLLGRLFRSTATSVTKTNLLVFIRPTIIREHEILQGATGEKYGAIRKRQLERRERGIDLLPIEDLPLLPEWEEQIRAAEAIRDRSAAAAKATKAAEGETKEKDEQAN